jgi:hypothetical protein
MTAKEGLDSLQALIGAFRRSGGNGHSKVNVDLQ